MHRIVALFLLIAVSASAQETNQKIHPAGWNLSGISAVVRKIEGKCVITQVLPEGGAADAKLQASDVILKVDGEDVSSLELSAIVEKLRGDPDTSVLLTIQREGEVKPMDVKVVRHLVKLNEHPSSTPLKDPWYNATFEFTTPKGEKVHGTTNLCGVGAIVNKDGKTGRCVFTKIFIESGAAAAGLQEGDAILKVDGLDATALSLEQIVDRLRGDPLTLVAVTVERKGEAQPLEIKVIRRPLDMKAEN